MTKTCEIENVDRLLGMPYRNLLRKERNQATFQGHHQRHGLTACAAPRSPQLPRRPPPPNLVQGRNSTDCFCPLVHSSHKLHIVTPQNFSHRQASYDLANSINPENRTAK